MNWLEKIKLLFAARQPLTELVGEIKTAKDGYKTVAFYVALLGTLGTLVAALNGVFPPLVAVEITTGLGVVYNIVRGLAKADQVGVKPVLQSTEFWIGALTAVSNGIVSLQTGGVNPAWLATAQTLIASVMAMSQNLGATQPPKPA